MTQESVSQAGNQQQRVSDGPGDEHPSATELMVDCFNEYARERPEVVALWAFGIGFVLGWKLKPW